MSVGVADVDFFDLFRFELGIWPGTWRTSGVVEGTMSLASMEAVRSAVAMHHFILQAPLVKSVYKRFRRRIHKKKQINFDYMEQCLRRWVFCIPP